MKKITAYILTVLMLCAFGGAFAFNWGLPPAPPEQDSFNLQVIKVAPAYNQKGEQEWNPHNGSVVNGQKVYFFVNFTGPTEIPDIENWDKRKLVIDLAGLANLKIVRSNVDFEHDTLEPNKLYQIIYKADVTDSTKACASATIRYGNGFDDEGIFTLDGYCVYHDEDARVFTVYEPLGGSVAFKYNAQKKIVDVLVEGKPLAVDISGKYTLDEAELDMLKSVCDKLDMHIGEWGYIYEEGFLSLYREYAKVCWGVQPATTHIGVYLPKTGDKPLFCK